MFSRYILDWVWDVVSHRDGRTYSRGDFQLVGHGSYFNRPTDFQMVLLKALPEVRITRKGSRLWPFFLNSENTVQAFWNFPVTLCQHNFLSHWYINGASRKSPAATVVLFLRCTHRQMAFFAVLMTFAHLLHCQHSCCTYDNPETKFSFSIKNIFNPVSQITFPICTNCAALRKVPLACATLYKSRASPRLSSVVHTVLINAAKLLDGVERYFVRQFHLVEFIFAFPTPQKRIAIVLIQGSATPCYIWIYVSD